jgi:hypothetical protein
VQQGKDDKSQTSIEASKTSRDHIQHHDDFCSKEFVKYPEK